MAGWNERRLENLEAECPERPRLVVLRAPVDEVTKVVERYRAETPREQWAELVVVVGRILSVPEAIRHLTEESG